MSGQIEVIDNATGKSLATAYRWRCSCGADTSGRWYRSDLEALKAAERHSERCPQNSQ